uniref:Putative metal ion transporter C17A12.14 n=2 Tax=Lygus hesperus TaxID=30085 RepID=A0A0A9YTT5_LYGHE
MLNEVDSIDEMVPLVDTKAEERFDFVRRIAHLRRRIAIVRNRLYLKENLLLEMLVPAMRNSFVCAHVPSTVRLYCEAMEKEAFVADRLDETRKVLNQANMNFVSGVAMRMSQSSARLDFKMQILGLMATICLPLSFLMGLLGMNCTIPFQADRSPGLTTF